MDVTGATLAASLLQDIQTAEQAQAQAASELASGRKFTEPGQDPGDAGAAQVVDAAAATQARYEAAANAASAWAQATGVGLRQASSLLEQVQQNALGSANGTLTQAERTATSGVVDQLGQQLLEVANSEFQGLYLFAGQQVTTQPFSTLTGPYGGDGGPISFEVGPGMTVSPSVPGSVLAPSLQATAQVEADLQHERYQTAQQASATAALGLSGSFTLNGKTITVSSTDSLNSLATSINGAGAGVTASVVADGAGWALSVQANTGTNGIASTDPNGILASLRWQDALNGADLQVLQSAAAGLLAAEGSVGAIQKGIGLQQTALQGQDVTVKSQQTTLEDANVAQESIAYSEAAQGLQAALEVTAKAVPPSIFQYLG